jgi:nitroimidazol reductase NimA-like FMN-containing flavoprotein (pyridoxamine 5'-phosphate oxidase superfamily)
MRANPQVSIFVHKRGRGSEWKSVVVDGRYEELPDRIGHKRERDRAWSLLSRHAGWWEPGAIKPVTSPLSGSPEHVFFRILVEEISGRQAKEGM